jgi:DNA-binding CsgD family transcriptional regulator
MLSTTTMLDVLSAAQANGGAPERWASDIPSLVRARAPGTLAVETEIYTGSDRRLRFLGEGAVTDRSREIICTGHESLTAEECHRIYETSTFVGSTMSFFRGAPPPELREAMGQEGIGDILGVSQPRRDVDEALCFTVLLEAGVRTDARLASRWATLVRHLGALAEARAWLDGGLDEATLARSRAGRTRAEGADEALVAAVRELDRRRAHAARVPGEDEAVAALDLFGFMLDRGFVVLEHASRGVGRRLVAVRLVDPVWDAECRLTESERKVLEAAARGLSNKEIGFELGVDVTTVATRLRAAQRRLGVQSRVELVRLARALGGAR